MPDNAESFSKSSRFQRRGKKPSMVPREVVFGLDPLERKVSLIGVGVAMLGALVFAIKWIARSPLTTSVKYVKGKSCPSAYATHVGTLCENVQKHADSYWATRFLFIFVVALIILFFALRRKRAGVACFACFLGLGLGFGTGVVFLFLGVWLIVRAFRLQRYGDATWTGSNRIAREMAKARREGRDPTPKASKSTAAAAPTPLPGPVAPPSASKRYTPKQKPRKR